MTLSLYDTDCVPKQWRYALLRIVSWQRVRALHATRAEERSLGD